MEKHRPKRIYVGLEVELASGSKNYKGTIASLSAKGIGVYLQTRDEESAKNLSPGTKVGLKFHIPPGEKIILNGEVKWLNTYKNPPHGLTNSFGIQFTEASPKYEEFFKSLE